MPAASDPFALSPLASSHPLFPPSRSIRSDARPRLAMPLPQRAVPVDESDSELDSAASEPTAPFLRPDTYPPPLGQGQACAPASTLVFDEHGELARVQSPADGAGAYAARSAPSWSNWPHANRLPTSTGNEPPALLSAASAQIALWVAGIFVLSTAIVVAGLATLPLHIPAKGITSLTMVQIRNISLALQTYATDSLSAGLHTWIVLLAFFTWKQAWSIPGSVVSNVLLGMMYGTYLATLYTSIFTATGGVLCYLLVRPVGPIISRLPGFQKPLDAMRRALALPEHASPHPAQTEPAQAGRMKGPHVILQRATLPPRRASASGAKPEGMSTWTYLLLLRLVPIVPWSAMNICCAVLGVPLWPYWASFLLGSVPWNFVTTQVGDILQDLLSALPPEEQRGDVPQASGLSTIKAKIWSREMIFKLALLTLASLLPMALQWWVKRRRAATAEPYVSDAESEVEAEAGPRGSTSILRWPQRKTSEAVQLLAKPSHGWGDSIRTPSPFGQLLRLASPTPREERERDVESSPSTEDEPEMMTPTSLGSVLSSSQPAADPLVPREDLTFRAATRGGRKPHLPVLAPLSPQTRKALVEDEWGAPARTPSPMQALSFARERDRAFALHASSPGHS